MINILTWFILSYGLMNIMVYGSIFQGFRDFFQKWGNNKLLPFNGWVKGILGSSNKLSGPMIASVYAAAIGLLFGNLLNTYMFTFDSKIQLIIIVVLLGSITAGEAMAYASTKVKEILLFSSIAQAALAVLVFFSGFVGWAAVMIAANAFTKFILFQWPLLQCVKYFNHDYVFM